MRNNGTIARQQGFVQAIALALILVIPVSLLMWRSSQTSSGNGGEQSAKAEASALVFQAGALKGSLDAMMMASYSPGGLVLCSEDSVREDCATAEAGLKGVFNPAYAAGSPQSPPGAAVGEPDTKWMFKRGNAKEPTVQVGRLGSAAADWVIHVPNIKDSVCRQINYQLMGRPSADDSNILLGMDAARFAIAVQPMWSDWNTPAEPVDLTTGLPAGSIMPMAGCTRTTAGADYNVFYQVVVVK